MRRILPLIVLALSTLVVTAAPSAAGGGCHGSQTEGAGTTVEMTHMCFTPTVLHVEPGTEVEFVNRDSLPHVVVGVGWGDWTKLGTGDTTSHRFDHAGAYPYTCNLHAGMNGVVIVGDESPLTTEPISTTREDPSSISPALFALAIAAVVAAVFAGRLTATRG